MRFDVFLKLLKSDISSQEQFKATQKKDGHGRYQTTIMHKDKVLIEIGYDIDVYDKANRYTTIYGKQKQTCCGGDTMAKNILAALKKAGAETPSATAYIQ